MRKLFALFVAAFVLSGCATTSVSGSGIKGKAGTVSGNEISIIDYQGASFGSEIPEWVIQVANGNYSSSALKGVMPDVEGRKIFVCIGSGDNLEFTKQWADLVDVEVQVGDTMQRVVGKAVSASMTGSNSQTGSESDPTEVERRLNMYKQAISAVELNGLEKTASYWIEKTVVNKKQDISKHVFEYYSVWTMDQKNFDRQVQAAMANVDDNTSEGVALKATLGRKLEELVVGASNDAAILEAAEY